MRVTEVPCSGRLLSVRCLAVYLLLLLLLLGEVRCAFDLYCGDVSCYELLELPAGRASTAAQVKKAFYRLSLLHHPDKASPSASAADAAERAVRYQRIVDAYEVLSNEASRASYHSFLDHPHLFSHHLRYYQHRVRAAQIPAWKVLSCVLLLSTLLHFLYIRHRHRAVRRLLASHPTVQAKMLLRVKRDLMEQLGRIDQAQIPRRMAAEEDNIGHYVLITGSEARRPTLLQLLPIELARWSANAVRGLWWWGKLLLYHHAMGVEYGEEEREWATARALSMSWSKWRSVVAEADRKELVKRCLWQKANMDEWVLERKQEMAGQRRSWR